MGAYPVLQPNGNFAIWNTVADGFSDLNLTEHQALSYFYEYDGRKGRECRPYREAQLQSCRETGRAFEKADTWPEAVAWVLMLGDCDREVFRDSISELGLLDPTTRKQVDAHIDAIRLDLVRDLS